MRSLCFDHQRSRGTDGRAVIVLEAVFEADLAVHSGNRDDARQAIFAGKRAEGKLGLRDLGAEVHEKSAVNLRDF